MTRFVLPVAARLARLAPDPLRTELAGPGLQTLREVCAAAGREPRLIRRISTVIGEIAAIAVAVVRSRFGRMPISGGSPNTPPNDAGRGLMDRVFRELRTAWRSLTAARSNALLAVATVALGIGINTAVFSVLDAIIVRPVPYPEADRLATMMRWNGRFGVSGGYDAAMIREWRRQSDLFDRVEGSEPRSFIYTSEVGAEMLQGTVVTPGLMSTLGATPLRGRLFGEGDGRTGTTRRVIVSEAFWRGYLGAADDAIGRTLVLDNERFDLVGILPRAFRYPSEAQDLWIPYDVEQPPDDARPAAMAPLVRFVPGATHALVDERVQARGDEVNAAAGVEAGARLRELGQTFDDRTRLSLFMLGGAVLFLLLIVCANVANLTLSRALARHRDRAVRSALGASRGQLVREALVEYGLVGLAGAAGGTWVAAVAIDLAVTALPQAMTISSLNAIDLDLRSLAFLAIATIFTVTAFGVAPALVSSRATVSDALRGESRAMTGSPASRRFRSALVVVEVCLSVVLLVGAALMTRSLMQLQAIDIGIDTENLLSMDLALPAPRFSGEAGVGAGEILMADLLGTLRRDPDVVSVSAAGSVPPIDSMVAIGALEVGGRAPADEDMLAYVFDVWPGFFHTMGITLVDGRDFRDQDVEGAAIVSERFASAHWPDGSAVGSRFRLGDAPWRTIVGVARDTRGRNDDGEWERPQFYYPRNQVDGVFRAVRPSSEVAVRLTLVVRASAPDAVAARLPEIVHRVDAGAIVSLPKHVERDFADAIARPRVVFVTMATFAGFGLLLAVGGLYGVLSHRVALRMREIGIRLALGATPHDIGRAVMGSGLMLTLVGVGLGLAAALALAGQMRSLLYEVAPFDPLALAVVTAVLLLAAILATWRPARRAMRADPVTLLRNE